MLNADVVEMDPLRKLIYSAKRIVHGNPCLYGAAYSILTFNWDYFRQRLETNHYPSKFGGQWTDRNDFDSKLQRKMADGEVEAADVNRLRQWREEGFVAVPAAVDAKQIADYNAELDRLPGHFPRDLKVTGPKLSGPTPYDPRLITTHDSIRLVDHYFFSDTARNILFSETLVRLLKLLFEAEPMLTQSLGFEFGSEQEMHQDTAFVITNSPMKMVGIWIALEDIQPGAGELIYYPGSHRWPDYLFSGRFKHYDAERDGKEQLVSWLNWIHREAGERNIKPISFLPKQGDALIWHAALAHGGAKITIPGKSRRSLVGHYCPTGTRPLYHYYKPAQRKVYSHSGYRYTTAYYR